MIVEPRNAKIIIMQIFIPSAKSTLGVLLVLLTLIFCPAHADVRLPEIFQNHMVIQRDMPVRVWGWAAPGESVTATFGGASQSVEAGKNGKWFLELPAFAAGGPHELLVEGTNKIVLTDILVGDVWICGGQSNMAWKIHQTNFTETDTAFLERNKVRLFTVDVAMDYVPGKDIAGSGWKILTKENVADFSAVGYHFGKYVENETGVPIGLVSNNLGATSIETWMSNEALLQFPQFEKEVRPIVERNKSFAELERDFEEKKNRWYKKRYFKGSGIDQQWFKPETDISTWRPIVAPGNTWEAEPELQDHDGAVWFHTTFDLPEGYDRQTYLIQLGQIDDYDITWVNGQRVGETFGRHNHRNYAVPVSALKEEGNVVVVRIFDTGGIGGFTTSPFWAGGVLKGKWLYRKGDAIRNEKFLGPVVPNATPFSSPGVLFNGMIAPLTRFAIKGVIWYQGESNASRAYEYRELFRAMIQDWRRHWGQGDFPFLFVQLANYMKEPTHPKESEWAELREAQGMALALPNTGMATAIDIGEANDIHPKNKADVGKRLALAALNVAYGHEEVVASGPAFESMQIENGRALIFFNHVGSGLTTRDKYGYIRGFQIAGADRKFYWARAHIDGDHVIVSSENVSDPVAVRYAWADNPGALDLYNEEGLPAVPFRTDTWRGSTYGKRFEDGPRF